MLETRQGAWLGKTATRLFIPAVETKRLAACALRNQKSAMGSMSLMRESVADTLASELDGGEDNIACQYVGAANLISVEEGTLTIKGEKKYEQEEKEKGRYRMERSYGSFERAIPLPTEADESKGKPEFKKSVLRLTIPKRPGAHPRRKKLPSHKARDCHLKRSAAEWEFTLSERSESNGLRATAQLHRG
jgi:hypothetical protein